MTYKEIENAYMHDLNCDDMQSWLKDNHSKIFYKNRIQRENPFVCGFIQGMVDLFIDKAQYEYDIPTWLFQYMATHRAKFITCVHDAYILVANKKQEEYKAYNDGYGVSLNMFKDAKPYIHENIRGDLTLFLI